MARVAFVGLGNMGGPMAANLVAAGHAVAGYDTSDEALARAEAAGIAATDLLKVALDGAEAVVTMLPAGEHVLGVWTDIIGAVPAGTLLIDCSTIDVASARNAHAMAAARQCLSLDAPVSGGTSGARAGTLTFMAGGDAPAFERGAPLFAAMGSRAVHCGDAGAGQAAKICNNMILGVSMIAVGEAFALAEKLGLSHQALYDVASTSSGQCWSLTTYCPVPGPVPTSPANDGYRPGFATALMLKDLALAQEAAAQVGAATPLGAHARSLYERFAEAGNGNRDFSAIFEALQNGDITG